MYKMIAEMQEAYNKRRGFDNDESKPSAAGGSSLSPEIEDSLNIEQ